MSCWACRSKTLKKDFHSHRGYLRRIVFQITIPLVHQASNDLPLNLNLSFRRSRNLMRSRQWLNAVKPRPTTPTSATPLWNSLNIIHFKKKLGATLCKTFHNPKIYIYIIVYKTSPFIINEYFIVITPLRRGLGDVVPNSSTRQLLLWTFPILYISNKTLPWLLF